MQAFVPAFSRQRRFKRPGKNSSLTATAAIDGLKGTSDFVVSLFLPQISHLPQRVQQNQEQSLSHFNFLKKVLIVNWGPYEIGMLFTLGDGFETLQL